MAKKAAYSSRERTSIIIFVTLFLLSLTLLLGAMSLEGSKTGVLSGHKELNKMKQPELINLLDGVYPEQAADAEPVDYPALQAELNDAIAQADKAAQTAFYAWLYESTLNTVRMIAVLACLVFSLAWYMAIPSNMSLGQKAARYFMYLVLSIGAVIMLFPFFWMFSSAFKTTKEINRFPPEWLPSTISLDNFVKAFQMAPFARYFLNSIIVMVCSVTLTTCTTILAAFAFSRLRFPGRNLIFSLLLSLMMIPFEMLIITNYTTIVDLNLIDSLPALILPFTSSIFYTYILRNFFDSVSDSLYWSARVDGSSNWRYLWRIMVPMARPSLMTIILLNALASWNSFMWPMYVIHTDTNRTLPWGLQVFTTEAGSNPELQMAASVVVVLPVILLFLVARKYIVRGVARGGLKG